MSPIKVIFSADSGTDALFDFGKSAIKPTGQRALDKFSAELKGADFEVITIAAENTATELARHIKGVELVRDAIRINSNF